MSTAATYRDCPGCEASAAQHLPMFSPDPWHIASYGGCSLTYLRNPPAYELLEEDFVWEKTYEEKKTTSKRSTFLSPYVRAIRNTLGMYRDKTNNFRTWFNDGHVLDIRSGWGQRITAAKTPYGIELPKALFKISDERMRTAGGYYLHDPRAGAICDFDKNQFDGIVMFSCLEHKTAVMGVLKGDHCALKKAGGAFIRVPNFGFLYRRVIGKKWCGFRDPDHVKYFSLATLTGIAKRAGFHTTLINTITQSVDDNISVLLHKSKVGVPT